MAFRKGVAVVSANLNGFEKSVNHIPQSVDCDFYTIGFDNDFPLRFHSMTPRLQARIVKTHMWQFAPNYEYYLWIDSSCKLSDKDSVKWFLDQVNYSDIAVFRHPQRETVQQEADYLKERLQLEKTGRKQQYILPRYENEFIDEQLEVIDPDRRVFASTAFIMKDSPMIRAAMKNWWYNISRYHSIDQLSLPHVIRNLRVNILSEDYSNCKWIEFVRNK